MDCAKIPRAYRDNECEGGPPLPKPGKPDYSVSIDSDIISHFVRTNSEKIR
jgi:hypothetical protein